MIPKKQSTAKASSSKTKLKHPKPSEHAESEIPQSGKEKPTAEGLRERLNKWIEKKIEGKGMTVDEAMKLFSIDETGDGKFSFKCKKHGCSSVFKMTATDTHCNIVGLLTWENLHLGIQSQNFQAIIYM